jgi:hypothetical protein
MANPRRRLRTFLSPAFSLTFFIALFFSNVPKVHALGPKGDAFFGYSRTGSDTFYPNVGGLNGWEGALHLRMRPFVGIEGDVAHYGLGANSSVPRTTTALFGPRLTLGTAGFKVFAHGLVGGEHSSNNNGISGGALTYAIGVGADVPVAPFFGWRFMVDRFSAPTQSPGSGTHARFSAGIVFRF